MKKKRAKGSPRKRNILIAVLVVIVVLAFGYIGCSKYLETERDKDALIFQEGAQYGYAQAIVQIIQLAVTCQQVPLAIDNQTVNMIAVGCLQPPIVLD